MKVLHVGAGNLFGGVESMLLTFAMDSATSLEHHFAFCFEGRIFEKLSKNNAKVFHLGVQNRPVRFRDPKSVLNVRNTFKELLKKYEFDVVIFHSTWVYVLFGFISVNNPLKILWFHNLFSGQNWLERVAAMLHPQFVVANSQYTLSTLRPFFKNSIFEVIYCPVISKAPSLSREKLREALHLAPDETVIIQTSRIDPNKGHIVLIKAIALLKNTKPHIKTKVLIVGDAQKPSEIAYLKELKILVASLNLETDVRFLEFRTDIIDLLNASDILCQPNLLGESFGIAFVEAMLAGLPVVTTNIGAAPEVLQGLTDSLIPPNDPEFLKEKLHLLISDPNLRRSKSEAAKIRAREVSNPNEIFRQMEALFSDWQKKVRA